MAIAKLRDAAHKDEGLTLVEVLVATVITALVALTLFRLTNDAANSLTGTVNQVVSTNQIIGFTRLLRTDIGEATDVFAFGEQAPSSDVGKNYLCSSWRSKSVATDWTNANSATFVRPLVSIPVLWADMTGNSTSTPTFVQPTLTWVGYEIRANATVGDYELWRVGCFDDSGLASATVNSERMLVSIPHDNFDPAAFGTIANGSTNKGVLTCSVPNNSSTSTPTPAATLGAEPSYPCNLAGTDLTSGSNANYSYFQFKFPYLPSANTSTPGTAGNSGVNLTTSDVAYSDSLTQLITRKIG